MIPFDLAAIFTQMLTPDRRADAALQLARYCGCSAVLLFGKDQEVGRFLPAAGLPQTLRQGLRWQHFLEQCATSATAAATLPHPAGEGDAAAYAMADPGSNAVLVLIGAQPSASCLAQLGALFPLLGAKLALERTLLAAEGQAESARQAGRHAAALNDALDANRRELESAYRRAEGELVSRREAEKKLRDADARKDEFLAMLAHELRNPLAPIAMAAQILKVGQPSAQRLEQTCQVIDRQVTHMTRLLDDLLDVSRVTGGMVTLAREAVDMRTVVEVALEQARPLIDAREHRLTVELSNQAARVTGDPTRLVQIVTNLLNNAAKYTPAPGAIELRLAPRKTDIVLTVSDNGVGIDQALLPHVFDLFIQGERSPDRSQGGLGLGLALVKSLAERHGGAIAAFSAGPGLGSRFELTLPKTA